MSLHYWRRAKYIAVALGLIISPLTLLVIQSSAVSAEGLRPILLSSTSGYMWNTQVNSILYSQDKINGTSVSFRYPNISVNYRAVVKNADTGAIVPCNSNVAKGTRLALEFKPHEYTDIYWFATGGNYDSPYGDWSPGATPPAISCEAKDFVDDDTDNKKSHVDAYIFAALQVAPPTKTITGVTSLSNCVAGLNGSKTCTAAHVGPVPITFTFAQTRGHFYPRVQQIGEADKKRYAKYNKYAGICAGNNNPMKYRPATGSPYIPFQLNVPVHEISCPITIVDAGTPPAPPSIPPGALCRTGQDYTLTVRGSGVAGDDIRFAVDWDSNGSIDQYVPATGYVATTASQTITHTFTTSGTKAIQVLTETQTGQTSAWTPYSLNCAETLVVPTPIPEPDELGGNETIEIETTTPAAGDEPSGDPACMTLSLRAVPSLVRSNTSSKLFWSSGCARSCTVNRPPTETYAGTSSPIGGQTTEPLTTRSTYTLKCKDRNGADYTKTATVGIIPDWQEL